MFLMVADHLGYHECQKLLGKVLVQPGIGGHTLQPRDLIGLPRGVGGRQLMDGLQLSDVLRVAKPLGKGIDKNRIKPVN